jgi:hypothetical protein
LMHFSHPHNELMQGAGGDTIPSCPSSKQRCCLLSPSLWPKVCWHDLYVVKWYCSCLCVCRYI